MKRKQSVFYLFVVLFVVPINLIAQVGINRDDPDTSVVLHIHHDSKGILVPRISSTADVDKVDGSFFYCTADSKFYYYCEENNTWQCLNPVSSTSADSINSDVTVTSGNIKLDDGNINVENGSVTVQGGDVTVAPENKFVGYGTVPIGGIIMWSGNPDNLPDGWALCDGQNGRPDLSGRFVVGYDPNSTDYSQVEATGGSTNNALQEQNIPKHRHDKGTFNITTSGPHSHKYVYFLFNGPFGTDPSERVRDRSTSHNYKQGESTTVQDGTLEERGGHSHPNEKFSGNTGYWGAETVTPVENRPPYYVIAYIIRVN